MRQLLLEFAEELFRCGMHGDGRVGRHRFGREVAQVRVDAVQVVDVRRHGLEDARDHFVGLIRAGDEQELRGDGGTVFLLEGIGARGDGQDVYKRQEHCALHPRGRFALRQNGCGASGDFLYSFLL